MNGLPIRNGHHLVPLLVHTVSTLLVLIVSIYLILFLALSQFLTDSMKFDNPKATCYPISKQRRDTMTNPNDNSETISHLLERLNIYYAQPFTPRSIVEAQAWEEESRYPIVSKEEAEQIKMTLSKLR